LNQRLATAPIDAVLNRSNYINSEVNSVRLDLGAKEWLGKFAARTWLQFEKHIGTRSHSHVFSGKMKGCLRLRSIKVPLIEARACKNTPTLGLDPAADWWSTRK